MMKKIGVLLSLLFLFFELIYFNSNVQVTKLQNNPSKKEVYKVSLIEDREGFVQDYKDIIVEESDDSLLVLTSLETLTEIQKKYVINIENN